MAVNYTPYSTVGGTSDADNILNYAANVEVHGSGGNDTIWNGYDENGTIKGGAGGTKLYGGSGNDIINNASNVMTLRGGADDDTVFSYFSQYVVMKGGSGNDELFNYAGSYLTVAGGSGSDSIFSNSYNSVIVDAGTDDDLLSITNTSNIKVYSGTGDDIIANDTIENGMFFGGEGNEEFDFNGNNANVTVNGGAGNDIIVFNLCDDGSTSAVIQYGVGDGIDSVVGFDSDDTICITTAGARYETQRTDYGTQIDIRYVRDDNAGIILYGYTGDVNIVVSDGTELNSETLYNYYSGNKTVTSYYAGAETINFNADLTGYAVTDSDITFNSSSGSLTVQNANNKNINLVKDGNIFRQFYSNNSELYRIDKSNSTVFTVIIGGDNFSDNIYAGNNGSSLWGGSGNNGDFLYGGDGVDYFRFGITESRDYIYNASSSDVVDLYDINLSDVTSIRFYDDDDKYLWIGFNNGTTSASTGVTFTENLSPTFKLADGTNWQFNAETQSWNQL